VEKKYTLELPETHVNYILQFLQTANLKYVETDPIIKGILEQTKAQQEIKEEE